MPKLFLEIPEDYDFSLIGISCHAKNYKLCWELNDKLELDLHRGPDHTVELNPEIEDRHAIYDFLDEENQVEYYLIENLGSESYLAPELKEADFFLMIKGAYSQLNADINKSLMNVRNVLAAFTIQPEKLKSRQNFLF